jgi:hypothetical protein
MTRTTIALAWTLAACSGSIADPLSGPDAPGEAAAAAEKPAAVSGSAAAAEPGQPAAQAAEPRAADDACQTADRDPGPAPLRRLTQEQYANTLRDLFGDVPGLAALLDSSSPASEFGLIQPDVGPVELEAYRRAAETSAAFVVTTPAKLQALAPCASGMDQRECARSFIQSFGARAYRAPLTDAADVDRHLQLYDAGKGVSHEHGIELVLRGMLQAPRFLYRVELGSARTQGTKAVRLSGPEIAARLSYVLWNTLPDAKLADAARSGRLDSPDAVRDVVAEMLADARGRHALRSFLERWMRLEKLESVVKDERFYPEWIQRPTLRASLAEQATRTLDDVLERQSGSLRALLTSSSVFVNADLAAFYGVSAGDTFQRVESSDGHASGILSLPGLMAVLAKPAESSPIYRGKFVREALLCQMLPAPPPNIPKPPEVQAGVSTRERLRQHELDPACSGCHQLMDPIGFGFENYDAIGRFRTQDAADTIDGRGELKSTRDVDGTFHGARELGERLAASTEVQECMTRQWFRYALARFERDVDACTLQELSREFARAGADLRVLPALLLTSDAFLTRRPLDLEETP